MPPRLRWPKAPPVVLLPIPPKPLELVPAPPPPPNPPAPPAPPNWPPPPPYCALATSTAAKPMANTIAPSLMVCFIVVIISLQNTGQQAGCSPKAHCRAKSHGHAPELGHPYKPRR